MSERNEGPDFTNRPASGKISRRKFLTLGAAAGVIGGSALVDTVLDLSTEERRVSGALEKFSGLLPSEAQLKLHFGNHTLTPGTTKTIDEFHPTMLLGEIASWQINEALMETNPIQYDLKTKMGLLVTRMLFPGTGSNENEINYHNSKLKEFIEKNSILIVASDVDISKILEEKRGPEELLPAVALGALPYIMLSTEATRQIVSYAREQRKNHRSVNRRQFLKIAGQGLGKILAIYLGVATYKGFVIAEPPEPISPLASKLSSAAEKLSGFLSTQNPENPWLGLTEAILSFRNNTMALNTWAALTHRSSLDRNERAFFYAGTAHRGALDLFLKGPKVLEAMHAEYARRLLVEGLDLLWEKVNLLELPKEIGIGFEAVQNWRKAWVTKELTPYASLFTEPTFFQEGELPPGKLKTSYLPRTPRTIFLKELDKLITPLNSGIEPENDVSEAPRSEILQDLRSTLQEEIARSAVESVKQVTDSLIDEAAPEIANQVDQGWESDIAAFIGDLDAQMVQSHDEIIAADEAENRSRVRVVISPKQVGESRIMGFARFRGSIVPILRTNITDINTHQERLLFVDYSIINGVKVELRRYGFKRANTQEELESLGKTTEANFSWETFNPDGSHGQIFRVSKYIDPFYNTNQIFYVRESGHLDPLGISVISIP